MKYLILFPLSIGSSIFHGFVFSKIWQWFIVSTFGVSPVSVVQSMGIALLVALVTTRITNPSKETKKEDSTDEWVKSISISLSFSALVLLSGWITQMFL